MLARLSIIGAAILMLPMLPMLPTTLHAQGAEGFINPGATLIQDRVGALIIGNRRRYSASPLKL
jgi:hypothetical protein